MKWLLGAVCVAVLVSGLSSSARADADKDVNAVLDKAIKALGGEEKLSTVKAATWKGKGKITFGGNDNDFTSQTTVEGLDHFRSEFEGEFGGNKVKGVTILNGDKGWRKFGDNKMDLDKDGVANEKRNVYLQVIPAIILPLKGGTGFKVAAAGEEKVDGKAAVGVKATGPDGKDFTIYFDKESGLPVKQVAKVVGFMGEEFTQQTTFGDYKDFGGVKKATKIVNTRDGEKFLELEITEAKILDKVDPKTFAEPE
jgi:hypothetical protein